MTVTTETLERWASYCPEDVRLEITRDGVRVSSAAGYRQMLSWQTLDNARYPDDVIRLTIERLR